MKFPKWCFLLLVFAIAFSTAAIAQSTKCDAKPKLYVHAKCECTKDKTSLEKEDCNWSTLLFFGEPKTAYEEARDADIKKGSSTPGGSSNIPKSQANKIGLSLKDPISLDTNDPNSITNQTLGKNAPLSSSFPRKK
ncbi:hypothetical protein ACO0LC_15715 [Undibacterium sp. JH2W]|uniref:hypothetical protein n=1 Tax=Undibacterium sp. JH2W TaxID=3413037 RepID=UPI003BF380D9